MTSKDKKRERFLRLAPYRTKEVLKRIRILGNCSNRSAYEYNRKEIERIFKAIEEELKETKARFRFPRKEKDFSL